MRFDAKLAFNTRFIRRRLFASFRCWCWNATPSSPMDDGHGHPVRIVCCTQQHCKCDEGNSIRLNEDFKDLIMANKRLMCLARLNGIHFFLHIHTNTSLFSPTPSLALWLFCPSFSPLLHSQVTKEMNIQAVWYTISTNYQEYKWILSLNSYAVQAPMPNWNAHQVCPR